MFIWEPQLILLLWATCGQASAHTTLGISISLNSENFYIELIIRRNPYPRNGLRNIQVHVCIFFIIIIIIFVFALFEVPWPVGSLGSMNQKCRLGGGFSFGVHILFNFAYFKPSWGSKLRNRNKNDNKILLAY